VREHRLKVRRLEEQEEARKEHAAVLEESLGREEALQRAFQEKDARSGAQLEQGEQDLTAQRQRADELELRLARAEEELEKAQSCAEKAEGSLSSVHCSPNV